MNNFDQSSSGVNLELDIYYDTLLSQDLFYECFIKADKSDQYGGDSVWIYVDHGNIGKIDLTDPSSYEFTKKDLLTALLEKWHKDDLDQTSKNYFDKPLSKLTKNELFLLVYEMEEIIVDTVDFYCEHLQTKFETVAIRGFCQGDYAEIIVPDYYFDEMGTEKPNSVEDFFYDAFVNYFYRAPFYALLTIDGNSFNFLDYINEWYDYDKGELLQAATENLDDDNKELILSWLVDNLPEQPDYC